MSEDGNKIVDIEQQPNEAMNGGGQPDEMDQRGVASANSFNQQR